MRASAVSSTRRDFFRLFNRFRRWVDSRRESVAVPQLGGGGREGVPSFFSAPRTCPFVALPPLRGWPSVFVGEDRKGARQSGFAGPLGGPSGVDPDCGEIFSRIGTNSRGPPTTRRKTPPTCRPGRLKDTRRRIRTEGRGVGNTRNGFRAEYDVALQADESPALLPPVVFAKPPGHPPPLLAPFFAFSRCMIFAKGRPRHLKIPRGERNTGESALVMPLGYQSGNASRYLVPIGFALTISETADRWELTFCSLADR